MDASGNLVEKYEYDPYGRTYISAPDGTARPVSAYGNPFAWTGQRYDPAVRLYHFWARSYSPALGRWLQRDPLGYVDGVGLYEYVGGQPLDYHDPYGLWWDTIADVCSLASNVYDWAQGVKTQVDFILDRPGVSYGQCKEAGKDCGEAALGIAGDAVGAALPFVTGGGKAAKTVVSKIDGVGASVPVGKKIPNAELQAPPVKRGNAPIGNDGHPVELHHRDQAPDGPVDEMTRTDHRGTGNYGENHQNTGQDPSEIDRDKWNKERRKIWENEWDSGRWKK